MGPAGLAAVAVALIRGFVRRRSATKIAPSPRVWIHSHVSERSGSPKATVSVRTIDAHRAHIKDKLGLRDGAELSYEAIRWMESQA